MSAGLRPVAPNKGSTCEASSTSLSVKSNATISPLFASRPICNLRQARRFAVPCFSNNHSPAPRSFNPVLSTIKCRSPVPILARSETGNPHARRLSVVDLPVPDHLLGRNIARRTSRVRTTTEPGDRTVDNRDTQIEAGKQVRERLAVGVVEVQGNPLERDCGGDVLDESTRFQRRPGSDRVAQGDFVATHCVQLGGNARDRLGVDLT